MRAAIILTLFAASALALPRPQVDESSAVDAPAASPAQEPVDVSVAEPAEEPTAETAAESSPAAAAEPAAPAAPALTIPKIFGVPKGGLGDIPWPDLGKLAEALGFDPALAKLDPETGLSCEDGLGGRLCFGEQHGTISMEHSGGAFNGEMFNPFSGAQAGVVPGGLLIGSW